MSKLLDVLSSIDESLKQIAQSQDVLAREVNPYYKLSTDQCCDLIRAQKAAIDRVFNFSKKRQEVNE